MLSMINLESEGSTTPRAPSKAVRYVGKVLSPSRVDMVVGVWSKSSTMLHLTIALAAAFLETHRFGGSGGKVGK